MEQRKSYWNFINLTIIEDIQVQVIYIMFLSISFPCVLHIDEVGSYKRIHSLAQMARNSCDSILAKVAEGVVKIFQEDMAYEHQDSYEDKNDYYT